jgi:hypothetical protein
MFLPQVGQFSYQLSILQGFFANLADLFFQLASTILCCPEPIGLYSRSVGHGQCNKVQSVKQHQTTRQGQKLSVRGTYHGKLPYISEGSLESCQVLI